MTNEPPVVQRRAPRERANWRSALWLRRHRVRGRRRFIWSVAVIRMALPVTLLATGWSVLTEPWDPLHAFLHLAANVTAGVIGGYVGGVVLWDLVVGRGGREPLETDRAEGS